MGRIPRKIFLENFETQNEEPEIEPNSYLEEGPRNSSLLINRIENDDGYLSIFTDIDTHVEKDDIVYITKVSGNSNLDNFNDFKYDNEFPFTKFNKGYKVLNVEKEKNKITINKIFRDRISNIDLSNHYVSLIKGEEGIINNSNLNSVMWKKLNIKNSNILQGIFLNINSSGVTFESKYSDDYKSLKRFFSDDGLVVNNNNYTYGYNFVGNYNKKSYLYNSDIENGNFINININSDKKRKILNGFFENCNISNYEINGGYFLNCLIQSSCTWNNGTFDNINGEDFKPEIWENGSWIRGNFSGKTWENGTFNGNDDSKFIDSKWTEGTFNNGIFENSDWESGNFNRGIFQNSYWSGGTINNNAKLKNSTWYDGLVVKGELINVNWKNGVFKQGKITNCIWENGIVENGEIQGTWFDGDFYNGKIFDSIWSGGTFYNGTMDNCIWYDGLHKNGFMYDTIWSGGTWENGHFNNGKWYSGNWEDGKMENSYIKDINWDNGNMINCDIDESGNIKWNEGVLNDTNFISKSGITELDNPIEVNSGNSENIVEISGNKKSEFENFQGIKLFYYDVISGETLSVNSGYSGSDKYYDIDFESNNTYNYSLLNIIDINDILSINLTGDSSNYSFDKENVLDIIEKSDKTIVRLNTGITDLDDDYDVSLEFKNRFKNENLIEDPLYLNVEYDGSSTTSFELNRKIEWNKDFYIDKKFKTSGIKWYDGIFKKGTFSANWYNGIFKSGIWKGINFKNNEDGSFDKPN